jgi:hypothetical protein
MPPTDSWNLLTLGDFDVCSPDEKYELFSSKSGEKRFPISSNQKVQS